MEANESVEDANCLRCSQVRPALRGPAAVSERGHDSHHAAHAETLHRSPRGQRAQRPASLLLRWVLPQELSPDWRLGVESLLSLAHSLTVALGPLTLLPKKTRSPQSPASCPGASPRGWGHKNISALTHHPLPTLGGSRNRVLRVLWVCSVVILPSLGPSSSSLF